MKKLHHVLVIILFLSILVGPTRSYAYTLDYFLINVQHELMNNMDYNTRKPYQGFESDYLIKKFFVTEGHIGLEEGEASFDVKLLYNGKSHEVRVDKDGDIFHFHTEIYDELKEWDPSITVTASDKAVLTITTYDLDGNVLIEEELANEVIKRTVPTGVSFCKSPTSYLDVWYPLGMCEEILSTQVEENKKETNKNKQDIEDSKKDIEQNKENIAENKTNIEVNKKDIEKNSEDIKENKESIQEVQKEVDQVKEQVLELESKVTGLEFTVRVIEEEVNGIKQFILTFQELVEDVSNQGTTPVEIWYRERTDVEGETEKEESVAFLNWLFTTSIAHAAEMDWYREKWDTGSELAFDEGKDYEVFLVSRNSAGEQVVEGFIFKATADGLKTEPTESKGPFEVEEELALTEDEPSLEVTTNEVEASEKTVVQKNPINIIIIVIGMIGMVVLGIVIGVYIVKRKEIHAVFIKRN